VVPNLVCRDCTKNCPEIGLRLFAGEACYEMRLQKQNQPIPNLSSVFSVELVSVFMYEGTAGTKVTNPKTIVGWSLGEDVGFMMMVMMMMIIYMIFIDTYRKMRPAASSPAVNNNGLCKLLSSVQKVTLRATR
jgi:hypothetical protein